MEFGILLIILIALGVWNFTHVYRYGKKQD